MSPGIDFWVKMADDEGIIKGKRDKEVKLVRPDGYEDIFAAISSGSDVGELSSDEEDLRSENTTAAGLSDLDYGPRKKRKQSSGKSGPFHSGDIIQFPAPVSHALQIPRYASTILVVFTNRVRDHPLVHLCAKSNMKSKD
jgi:hypothetical protein